MTPLSATIGSALTSLAQGDGDVDLDSALPDDGITRAQWITAGLTVVGFIVAAVVLRKVVERIVRRTDTEGQIAVFVGKFVQNALVLVGIVYALNALGVSIGPLLGALGITGIAIAFALTAVLENVFASVVLKTRRPIRLGDQFSALDQSGTLEEVNFRTVVMRNFDGEKVVIPSAMVNNDVLVNHTDRPTRRTVLPVGVHYDTDLALAQRVILDAVRSVEGVEDHPAPQAWVTTFGDSSIDFDVRYWHRSDILSMFRTRSEVAMAIKAGFDAAGIEIPFPQRVVTMVDDDAGDD